MKTVSAKYAFITAYLKGEETRCVTGAHLDEMLRRTNPQEMIETIRHTDIGDYLLREQGTSFAEDDRILLRYLDERLAQIRRFSLPKDVLRVADAFMAKFDILNIKIALRRIRQGETLRMVPCGMIHYKGYLDRLAVAETCEEIASVMTVSGMEGYADCLKEVDGADDRSCKEAEERLGAYHYGLMRQTFANAHEGIILLAALGTTIDLANLQVLFRSLLGKKEDALMLPFLDDGRLLSPTRLREFTSFSITEIARKLEHTIYDTIAQEISKDFVENGDVTVIDRVIERTKYRLLKEILAPRLMSPAVMLWYLSLKEWEIRNIRMILKGGIDGIPSSLVKIHVVMLS